MHNNYLKAIVVGASLLASAPLKVFADEVSVGKFVSGTVISSADVNNNFEVLAAESNENDSRLSTLENITSGLSGATTGRQFSFAGYTTSPFLRDNYGSVASFWTTSLHCKQEFGDKASILTTNIIYEFIVSGNVLNPLPAEDALIWLDSGETVTTFLGESFGVVTPRAGIRNDRVEDSKTYTIHNMPIRVACIVKH